MTSAADKRALVERYAAAVSARDIDAVMAMFADGAEQHDPYGAAPNVGHDAIATFLRNGVGMSTATLFEALAVHTAGDRVAFDFRITVTLASGTMVISGIEVFTVGDDGRITRVEAYWDEADVTFAQPDAS